MEAMYGRFNLVNANPNTFIQICSFAKLVVYLLGIIKLIA